jgi:uncharacterized damage-inducible protein DinB
MRLIDPLLMELDREASTTRKVLERVPDDRLGWAPHPKSFTAGKLAWHLATLPGWVAESVGAEGLDVAAAPKRPPVPATTKEIVETFGANVDAAKKALARLDDAAAAGEWTLSMAGRVLMAMPRAAFVRNILLNHSYHHRGQLTVYLRLLDVPVPPVYGPTADENPFAG